MQVHASVPAAFHMTVFMTSQPSDPRPDPFNPEGGGMNPGSPPVPIPAPSAACLQQELAAFKGLAAVSGPPVFQVSAGPDPVADGLHGKHIGLNAASQGCLGACSTGRQWCPQHSLPLHRGQQECRGDQLCQQQHQARRAVG